MIIIILEVFLALIAVILIFLSQKTLGTIKRLGVGRSFWIPTLLSGVFFLFGSITSIFTDLGIISFLPYLAEATATFRLIGLCVLVAGIFMYSRKIRKNLGEGLSIPAMGGISEPARRIESSPFPLEREEQPTSKRKNVCQNHFGYLRTLGREISMPEECLSCNRVIECKHKN